MGDLGRLLLGSANLSRAALLGTTEPWANVEAGVIVELPTDELRDSFLPPECRWRDTALDEVAGLSFKTEERPRGFPLHLKSAWPEADGRVRVELNGALSAGCRVRPSATRNRSRHSPRLRAICQAVSRLQAPDGKDYRKGPSMTARDWPAGSRRRRCRRARAARRQRLPDARGQMLMRLHGVVHPRYR
jgi:hypothetical protein